MELFSQLEGQYGLPAGILDSIWNAESGRGKAMLSPKGAQGHFQFMPATAKQYGVQDPADLTQSATGAARMLSDLLAQSGGDVNKALAGYNWGIGNVQRKGMEAAPAETRNYIAKVTGSMQPQDQSSDEWAALAQKFAPASAQAAPQQDEWAQLASQFAQPTAQPAPQATQQAPQELSRLDKFGRGLRDPIDGGAQLLTNLLPRGVVQAGNAANNWLADKTGLVGRLPEGGVDQQVRESDAAYQAARGKDAGIDGYRILGNVLNPANLALGAQLPAAASLAGRIGVGAAGGAASSLLNPVAQGDFANEKLKQLAIGTVGGAAVPAIAGAVGRVISPAASRNPELQALRAEGVQPTIGQTLGGAWNKAEEKLMSLPIMGDMIAKARGNALEDFNQAAINRATTPIGAKVQGSGQQAVAEAGDALSAAYNNARNKLGNFAIDQQGAQEIGAVMQMAKSLPKQEQAAFNSVVNKIKGDISPNGTVTADVFKRIDSTLGKEAAKFSGAQDAYQQQLGTAFQELQRVVLENAKRANPDAAAMFKAADKGWANLVRVEGAAKAGMNNGGVFTPAQLQMAVRQADQSVRDRATARGTALMQDLSGAGQSVLGNKVPNSATADRLMLGAGGIGAGLIHPAIPMGLLGGAAMYTKPMQGLLGSLVAARPGSAEAVRQSLLQASPGLIPAGAQVGLGLLE